MVEMVEPMAGVLELIKINETVSSDSRTNGWSSGMDRQGRITNDSIYGYVGWGSVLMVMEVGLMAAVVKLMV